MTFKEAAKPVSGCWHIPWGLSVLALWSSALIAPLFVVASLLSYFAGIGRVELFGEPLESTRDLVQSLALSVPLGVIGLVYVFVWRKRAHEWSVRRTCMIFVFLVLPLINASVAAYHYGSLVDRLRVGQVTVRVHEEGTGQPLNSIGLGYAASALPFREVRFDSGIGAMGAVYMRAVFLMIRPVKIKVTSDGYEPKEVLIENDSPREIDVGLVPAKTTSR
jgi:hypothetical protein